MVPHGSSAVRRYPGHDCVLLYMFAAIVGAVDAGGKYVTIVYDHKLLIVITMKSAFSSLFKVLSFSRHCYTVMTRR